MNKFMKYPVKIRFKQLALFALIAICGLAGTAKVAPPLYRMAKRHLRLRHARAQWRNVLNGETPTDGSPVCNLVIPALDLDIPVLADSKRSNLSRLPCISATCSDVAKAPVIVAHRDLHFRGLQRVAVGDRVYLTRRNGEREEYRVLRVHMVLPDVAQDLADGVQGGSLTLITCYPFRYIGAAPERFVVVCERY